MLQLRRCCHCYGEHYNLIFVVDRSSVRKKCSNAVFFLNYQSLKQQNGEICLSKIFAHPPQSQLADSCLGVSYFSLATSVVNTRIVLVDVFKGVLSYVPYSPDILHRGTLRYMCNSDDTFGAPHCKSLCEELL